MGIYSALSLPVCTCTLIKDSFGFYKLTLAELSENSLIELVPCPLKAEPVILLVACEFVLLYKVLMDNKERLTLSEAIKVFVSQLLLQDFR